MSNFKYQGEPRPSQCPCLQGFCTIFFSIRSKTDVFKKKLVLWDSFVQKGDTNIFTTKRYLKSVDAIAKELLDIRQYL